MASAKNNTAKKTVRKKRVSKNISKGQCHISTSFNNTIVTFTDCEGNTLSWFSSGRQKLKGSKKGTPYAAQTSVEEAGKIAMEQGLKSVEVFVKGPGQGREQAIRTLGGLGLEVTLIKDVSPIAHNGCKPPKRRRV